jgi:hypothetical protein
MSTISTNDDATPMVQGTADMIDAALGVVEGVIAPQQKQKQPAQGQGHQRTMTPKSYPHRIAIKVHLIALKIRIWFRPS